MPFIKDVYIDVITNVSVGESSSTTDHALEDGEQITDHTKADPITISLTGTIYDDTEQKVLKLREYREQGALIDYDYMTSLKMMVITDFSRDYSASTKDGYAFTMTLKQIKVAKVSKTVSMSKSVNRQMKSVTNNGRQELSKKGVAS